MSRSVSPNESACCTPNLTSDELSARRIWNDLERNIKQEPSCCPRSFDYEGYARIIGGRGTVCIPLAANGDLPPPQETRSAGAAQLGTASDPLSPVTNLAIQDSRYQEDFGLSQGLNYELIPPEEIQQLWNQVVQDSNKQVTKQLGDQARQSQREKSKKLELLLEAALKGGNIDLAMLLLSGLETSEANEVASLLMERMQKLQAQKRSYAEEIAKLGTSPEDAKKTADLNLKIGDIGTEMQMLQTFLQDITSQKNEVQQMASNYLKSKHETGMGIIRNMA